ncbi:MAG: DEAD/DEAH box helicase [Deltaproteobacteria bacterium]|nr:DEAD/DEAH box helicase [Deltaproteobacteria bacterium]
MIFSNPGDVAGVVKFATFDALAITQNMLQRSDFIRVVNHILRDQHNVKTASAVDISAALDELLEGLPLQNGGRAQSPSRLFEDRTRAMIRDNRYAEAVKSACGQWPLDLSFYFDRPLHGDGSSLQEGAAVMVARYQLMTGFNMRDGLFAVRAEALLLWFSNPFPTDLFKRLHRDMRGQVLARLLEMRLQYGFQLDSEMWQEIYKLAGQATPVKGRYFRDALRNETLFSNVDVEKQPSGHIQVLGETTLGKSRTGISHDAYKDRNKNRYKDNGFQKGLLALRIGDADLATSEFAAALKELPKDRERIPLPLSSCALFMPMALMATEKAGHMRRAKGFVKRVMNDRVDLPALTGWGPLCDCEAEFGIVLDDHSLFALLFSAVGKRWRKESIAPIEDQLQEAVKHATEMNLLWLAQELRFALNDDDEGLLRLVKATPVWERQLRDVTLSLQKINDDEFNKVTAAKNASARKSKISLEWQIEDGSHKGISLAAWEVGKNRAMGDRRILGRSVELHLDHLADEDACLVDAMRRFTPNAWDLNNLEGKEVGRALIGHPRMKRGNEPVQIVEGQAKLEKITRDDGMVGLVMTPLWRGECTYVHREGIVEVVFFSEAQAKVGKTLGGSGVFVPLEEEKKLENMRPLLEPYFIPEDEYVDVEPKICALMDVFSSDYCNPTILPFGINEVHLYPGEGPVWVTGRIDGKPTRGKRDLDKEAEQLKGFNTILYEIVETFDKNCPDLERALLVGEFFKDRDVEVHWQELGVGRYSPTVHRGPKLSLRIHTAEEWFTTTGVLALPDGTEILLDDVLEKIVEGEHQRIMPMEEDRFVMFDDKLVQKLKRLARLQRTNSKGKKIKKGVHISSFEELFELATDLKADIDEEFEATHQRFALVPDDTPLPEGLQATLRDYQLDAFHWLARLSHLERGGILADDMGLGKTLCALALLLHRRERGPALVIVPTSLLRNWQEEAARFTPALKVQIFHGPNRKLDCKALEASDVVVTSYGVMLTEVEKFARTQFATLVFDESQALKNGSTKKSIAAKLLQAEMKLALSGTPIENHLGELHAQLAIVAPNLLSGLTDFKRTFMTPINKGNTDAVKQLKDLVTPYLLRRTKEEVLHDLPAKTEVNLWVDLLPDEAMQYEVHRTAILDDIQNARSADVLSYITKLRLSSCAAHLVRGQDPLPSGKTQQFLDVVEQLLATGHQALVFSQFTRHLHHLREALIAKGISFFYLDGSTTASERARLVKAYQAGEVPIFLISLRAGGVGLNLTAADYVLHMDPWWNPAVEDQASDRVHRIGQERPVTVYRFIARGTIEEKVLNLHRTKRELADKMLSPEHVDTKLTQKDLLMLL